MDERGKDFRRDSGLQRGRARSARSSSACSIAASRPRSSWSTTPRRTARASICKRSNIRRCVASITRSIAARARRCAWDLRRRAIQYVIVQDADLEYDPRDYRQLLEPLIDGRADMVYGSRFLGGPHRVLFFWHYLGNRLLTLVSDMMSDLNLTDMETGMKAFRRDKLMQLKLQRRPLHLRTRDHRQGGARRDGEFTRCRSRTRDAPTMRARRSAGATRSPRSRRSSTTGSAD